MPENSASGVPPMVDAAADLETGDDDDDEAELKADDLLEADPEAEGDDDDNEEGDNEFF